MTPLPDFPGMDYRSVLPRARKRGVAEKFAEFAAERARDHAVELGLVSHPGKAEIVGFNDMARGMRTPFGTVHADWYLAKQHVIARVKTWNNQGYLRVLPNAHVDTYYEPSAAAYGDHDCDYYSRNIRLKPGQTIHRETLMDLEQRNASLRRMNGGNPNTEPTGQFAQMMDQISNGPERLAAVRDIEDLEPFIGPTQELLNRYPVPAPVKENYPGSLPDDIARERLGTLLAREFGLKIPAHL